MIQNPANQWWILDTGDDPQFATALRALLYVDGEHPFQSLRPAHGRQWLVMVDATPNALRHDLVAMLGIWREDPMKAGEV